MNIVIIGNSATAVGAIESLRQHDQSAEVLVISEEPHMIYSRPLLSHYLAGEIDKARLAYRRADFYARHHVQPVLSSRVVAIEPRERQVHTESGQTYPYDKLLICTGGTPIVPPIPGLDAHGAFSFTRFDDTQGILRHLESVPVKRAVVVGGGMIGLKATDALMKRGLAVTIVELAPRILSAALDEIASRMMTDLLHGAGTEVLTDETVVAVHSEEGQIRAVELRDGRIISCELLIFGIGVRPNASLAKEAGIAVNRGIVVDEHMRTSIPDVYAAGDVAEAYDLVVDMNRTVAIWPNAYRQGMIAGAHMVGVSRADRGGIAMNTVEVCGVPAMSIGNGNASGDGLEVLTEVDERRSQYKRLVLQGDRLVGAILVGRINRAGIYTGLIRNKLNIGATQAARNIDWRKSLMSEHFGLLSLPDEYRKHIVTGAGIEV
jgi:NAD(P)H-nitrite reductase large subunit